MINKVDSNTLNNYIGEYNLESRLKKLGLNDESIRNVQNEYPQSFINERFYNDLLQENVIMLVNPKKIRGSHRLDSNKSIFENAKYGQSLDKRRMYDGLYYLEHRNLKELYCWYESQCSPISLIKYEDEDVYIINRDGTHRSLYAKLISAPLILSEVNIYKRNLKNYKTYNYLLTLFDMYDICSVETGVRNERFIVTFKFMGKEYYMRGYTNPITNDNIAEDSLVKRLENELQSDWSYLYNNRYLQQDCSDPMQRMRISRHIEKRNKVNKERIIECIRKKLSFNWK